MRRVVVTGMAGITPMGDDWAQISTAMKNGRNAVKYMPEWERLTDMNTRLAAPADHFSHAGLYPRKKMRSMGRVAALAVKSAERALEQSGLLDDPLLKGGRVGVAFGSSYGSTEPTVGFARFIETGKADGLNATSYIRMMSHTAAVNIGVFFGLKGRMHTTSSACTSGSQAIGYSYESIKAGHADVMIAGGAEELCPTMAIVFDALFATSCRNQNPGQTPQPFDESRDGLVIGEGASTLVLENREHAIARGAPIFAEIVGFGTNTDGAHITDPVAETMAECLRLSLQDAGIPASEIGFVCGHGTATEQGDIAEASATNAALGERVPINSLKSYFGHTLGACGAIEAWLSIEMMNCGSFAPTVNLENVDRRCAPLDYVRDGFRQLDVQYMMSNNFAFGGVNTSLIFSRL